MKKLYVTVFLIMLSFPICGCSGTGPEIDSPKEISRKTISKLEELSRVAFISVADMQSNDFFEPPDAFDRKINSLKLTKIVFKNDYYNLQGEVFISSTAKQDIYFKDPALGHKLALKRGITEKTHSWFRANIRENSFGDLKAEALEIYMTDPSISK